MKTLLYTSCLCSPRVLEHIFTTSKIKPHQEVQKFHRLLVEELAENIRRIFTDDQFTTRFSEGGIDTASKRHGRKVNLEKMLHIYREINADSE